MAITAKIKPPIVPSQVFLGEIGDKGVLPMSDPTRYAMVSFTHKLSMIASTSNLFTVSQVPCPDKKYAG